MSNTLFLRLEGPLQAWGERAHWDIRDTATEPTKSGVVGLLGCAMGLAGDDELREFSQTLKIGVRCDREGTVISDFHTITGGIMNAEGKIKPSTVVSRRAYLSDASFLVAIQADPDLILQIVNKLKHPVWPFYLGRKSCPPSRPVLEGVGQYPDIKTALQDWKIRTEYQKEAAPIRVVIDAQPGQGILRRDEIEVNSRRVFSPRYTRETTVQPALDDKEE
jgi:CRISPR system Cascade subunit CasD